MLTPPDLRVMVLFAVLLFCPTVSGSPLPVFQHGSNYLVRRGMVSPSNQELMENTIAFGAVAVFSFLLRMCNRVFITKAFKKEDWFMGATMFFYGALMALINISARFATNLYPAEQEAFIMADPSDIASRIIGSKLVIALEQCMIAVTWGTKFCIWSFVMRLFRQLPSYERMAWYVFWYICAGFVIIEIVYYGVFCRPFTGYWALPVPPDMIQCATYQYYSIVQMVLNISSDLMLIALPLPLIWRARIPKNSKILLVLLFCMAGFTILAAVLNKYYNFESPMTTVYQLWYIREASVAVIVGNLICTYQLWQRAFRWKTFSGKHTEIRDEQPMPQMPHPNLRKRFQRVCNYMNPAGDTFETYHEMASDHTGGTTDDSITLVGDTSETLDVEAGQSVRKQRPVTIMSNYMMTLNKDGEGDARHALAFREKMGID